MRYDAGQKETTHLRLLQATTQSLRARGVAATTSGGFYPHFRSRDELDAAGIRGMFSPKTAATPPPSRRRTEVRPLRPTWISTSAGRIGAARA